MEKNLSAAKKLSKYISVDCPNDNSGSCGRGSSPEYTGSVFLGWKEQSFLQAI